MSNEKYTITDRHEESIYLTMKELVKVHTDMDGDSLFVRFQELTSDMRETTIMYNHLLNTLSKVHK